MGKNIETDRLILRAWHDDDAADLYKYACDPAVGPPAGWDPHTSVDYSLEVIHSFFSGPEVYAVVLKETGEAIGCCGITYSDRFTGSDEPEVGYWIGRPYWGQGLIPEAVKAILNRGFVDLSLPALWCGHYRHNHKSQRVCEKCGFPYHHTIGKFDTGKEDDMDELVYCLTADAHLDAMTAASLKD